MKVKLEKDEWYPVIMQSQYGQEYDIPEAVLKRNEAAYRKFADANGVLFNLMVLQDNARIVKRQDRSL